MMCFFFMIWSLLLINATVSGQVDSRICALCEDNGQVGSPNREVWDFMNNRFATCSRLQEEGLQGERNETCAEFSASFAQDCQCQYALSPVISPTTASSPFSIAPFGIDFGPAAPVAAPVLQGPTSQNPPNAAPSMLIPTTCHSPVPYYSYNNYCEICGYNMVVGNPNGDATPSECPYLSCDQLAAEGWTGSISEAYCQRIQADVFIRNACDCLLWEDYYNREYGNSGYGSSSDGSISNTTIFIVVGCVAFFAVFAVCRASNQKRDDSRSRDTLPVREIAPTGEPTPDATEVSDPKIRQRVLEVLFPQQKPESGRSLRYDPSSRSYRFTDDQDDNKATCCICLDNIADGDQVISGLCTHSYHRSCIMDWLQLNNNDCPLCRQAMWDPEVFKSIEAAVKSLPEDDKPDVDNPNDGNNQEVEC